MKTNTVKFSILDAYLKIICIFPIFTVLIDGTIVNKLLFAMLILLNVLSYLMLPIKRKTFFLLFAFIFHYVIALCFSNFPIENVNLLFYFPFFLVYAYFCVDHAERIEEWLGNHKKFIYQVIHIWSFFVCISIFLPGCYYIKEGGELYFGSWCNSIWRLGPSAMFIHILSVVCMTVYSDKRAIVWTFIPMFCYFMGSSRSYLVVGLCLFAIAWYIFCNSSIRFWVSAIPMAIVLLIIVFSTPIGEKIIYTLNPDNYGDFWYRVTSSRSEFWAKDIEAWKDMAAIKQLFGSGIDFTMEVSGLWAHNDFLELLCSFGMLGLLHYLYAMKRLFNKTFATSNIPWIVGFMYIMLWLFNAFFNMHYTYFCAMLSYPILGLALKEYFVPTEKRIKNG